MILSSDRKTRRYLCHVLASVAIVLASFVGVPAADAAQKGVATDLTWGIGNVNQDRSLTALKDLRAGWAEITVSWAQAEPSAGSYDTAYFAEVDRAVTLLRGAGIRIIASVGDAPTWASGQSSTAYPPTNPADYAKFMKYVAGRYKGKIAGWQIWNEPNHPFFWPSGPNASEYVPLLKAGYPAVKAGDPNAKVMFGGLAFSDYPYLEAAYAAAPDLGKYFDVMSLHPYSYKTGPDAWNYKSDGSIDYVHSFQGYRKVRASMVAHGDSKPIWITELGWAKATSPQEWVVDSEQTVVDYLKRAYKILEQDPYVEVALWYNLRGRNDDPAYWVNHLGLMEEDFSRKPAYFAFRDYQPPAASSGTGGAAFTRTATTTTMRVRRTRSARATASARARRTPHRFRVAGRVSHVWSGTVVLELQRGRRGRPWKTARKRRVRISPSGRYARRFAIKSTGRWRLRARYLGSARYAPSKSRFAYFRTRSHR